MKTTIIFFALFFLATSTFSFAQKSTDAVTEPPPIPEEARKHFVMGTTLFKDAKTPGDYSQVVSEFKQAADLAPKWPQPRYNLAVAEEVAGNYSGAEADLKVYQQFKLSDEEVRSVQDKIYELEAKHKEITKRAADAAAKTRRETAHEEQWNGIWRITEIGPGQPTSLKRQKYFQHYVFDVHGSQMNVTCYIDKTFNDRFTEGTIRVESRCVLNGRIAEDSTNRFEWNESFTSIKWWLKNPDGSLHYNCTLSRIDDPKLISSKFK